ncbi:hypothetical protein Acsp01_54680 [Actinoplanes sp. NBRC 101535]|nr:hypothetical protein Acsp01_54680 [Actinoplanes sp. NBRC 101535]
MTVTVSPLRDRFSVLETDSRFAADAGVPVMTVTNSARATTVALRPMRTLASTEIKPMRSCF